jgi:hypothetical protein
MASINHARSSPVDDSVYSTCLASDIFAIVIHYTLIPTSSTTFVCSSPALITNYGNCWVIVGYYFLPMILTVVFFSLTWYNLMRLRRRLRRLDAAVTRMMLIEMSILLANGIPASGFLSYLLATLHVVKTTQRSLYETLILYIVILTTFLTNGVSFWVCLIASSAFRKHIIEFLCKCKRFKRRVAPFPMEVRIINTVKWNCPSGTDYHLWPVQRNSDLCLRVVFLCILMLHKYIECMSSNQDSIAFIIVHA